MCRIDELCGARLGGPPGNCFIRGRAEDTGYRLSLASNRQIVDKAGHATGYFVGGIAGREILRSDGHPTGLSLRGCPGRLIVGRESRPPAPLP